MNSSTQESSMSDKPYFDSREQSVSAPVLARTPAEEARRIYGVEAVGALVREHGLLTVREWAALKTPDPQLASLVEEFGIDLVRKWIGYFAHVAGGRS